MQSIIGMRVCCGKGGVKGKHIYLTLPSEAALAAFSLLNSAPPADPAKFVLRMLAIFFTSSELEKSNCTKAEGRELLDQEVIQGIKCKWITTSIIFTQMFCQFPDQTNYKYPVAPEEEERRWQQIVIKSLNAKCRSSQCAMRKKSTADLVG